MSLDALPLKWHTLESQPIGIPTNTCRRTILESLKEDFEELLMAWKNRPENMPG